MTEVWHGPTPRVRFREVSVKRELTVLIVDVEECLETAYELLLGSIENRDRFLRPINSKC